MGFTNWNQVTQNKTLANVSYKLSTIPTKQETPVVQPSILIVIIILLPEQNYCFISFLISDKPSPNHEKERTRLYNLC